MTDLSLSALLESTRALHERFGVPFRVNVSERLVAEEFRELMRESVLCDADWYDGDKSPLSCEAVNLFVVVLALLQAHGVTDDDLAQAMAAVIAKNDAKTHATHELVNGKITRRSSVSGRETDTERTKG